MNSFISALTALIVINSIAPATTRAVLASHEMSLEDRYPVKEVNSVFKDNILLDLAYLRGEVKPGSEVKWPEVEKPFTYTLELDPGQTFAFHEDVLPEFKDKILTTTKAHFNYQEGFKSDGYLMGDGVCHLASLLTWVAKDAKLKVEAPTNHDFATIPDVPKEFGTAIYFNPGSSDSNSKQNLYITNNFEKPVQFVFEYKDNTLKVSSLKQS